MFPVCYAILSSPTLGDDKWDQRGSDRSHRGEARHGDVVSCPSAHLPMPGVLSWARRQVLVGCHCHTNENNLSLFRTGSRGQFSHSRDFSHMRFPSNPVNSVGPSMGLSALLDQGLERGQKKGRGRQSQTRRSIVRNQSNESAAGSVGSPFGC